MTPPEVGRCPEVVSISSPRLCQPGLSHSTEMVTTQNRGILLFAPKRGAESTSLEVHERFSGAVVAVYRIDFQGHIRHLNVLGDPGLKFAL